MRKAINKIDKKKIEEIVINTQFDKFVLKIKWSMQVHIK